MTTPPLRAYSCLILLAVATLFLMGPGKAGCMGGSSVESGANSAATSDIDIEAGEAEGGSVAGNPEGEWGGSQAGNPEGGSVVGNPVRLIVGSINKVTDDFGNESCEFDKVIFVDSGLKHETDEITAVDDCRFSHEIVVAKEDDPESAVGKAVAVVPLAEGENFAVSDLGGGDAWKIIGPGTAPEGEAKPIDLGLVKRDAVTLRAIPSLEIAADDLVIPPELVDMDGDGLHDGYDDFMTEWMYGFYLPASIKSRSGLKEVQDVSYCPYYKHTVQLELKPSVLKENPYLKEAIPIGAAPSPDDEEANEQEAAGKLLELLIHYKVLGEMTAGPTVPKMQKTFGTVEAGFLRTYGSAYFNSKLYHVECKGWLERQESSPEQTADLDVLCQYVEKGYGKPADPLRGTCYFWDAKKIVP